jgi:hypothetical protein
MCKAIATAIDSIFIDRNIIKTFSITPLPNGLSDHNVQLLTLSNISILNSSSSSVTRRSINEYTTMEFKMNLRCEYWADVFNLNDDLNSIFSNFLNTYLRIFNNNFPYKTFVSTHTRQPWLKPGIKVSSTCKRELYWLSRNIDDLELTRYYKKYCKVFTEVINLAKHRYYKN